MTQEPLRIPLLRDCHSHPLLYAAFMDGIDLNREPAEPRDQAVGRIRAHAQAGNPGWTIAYGWNSGRYPLSKQELDDLPPLVVFNISLHGLIVNDAGLALLERSAPDVAGNLANQDWIERNLRRVLNVFANDGASPGRLQRFFRRLLEEHGVYHAEEMLLVGENEIRLFEESGLTGRTRFWAAPEVYEGLPRSVQEKIHGIKLFTDGALGAWTAALHRPYRGSAQSGMLLYEPGELAGLLARYLGMGKPIALHAIGDRAIDQVVSAVEAVERPAESEIRIEHAQLISEPAARRAKALGIRLCMQPNFSDDSIYYADRLPEGYPERNNPFRMLIDQVGYVPGVDLLFGSDGMPHGVHEGLRQSLFPSCAGQALTIDDFVAGYCLPDDGAGHIEARIDPDNRQVTCRIVPSVAT
ncbi:MAG TPA: amidohydrolase family protein [Thermoanaerobaculia bacterium]